MENVAEQGEGECGACAAGEEDYAVELAEGAECAVGAFDCDCFDPMGLLDLQRTSGSCDRGLLCGSTRLLGVFEDALCTAFFRLYQKLHHAIFGSRSYRERVALQWNDGMA